MNRNNNSIKSSRIGLLCGFKKPYPIISNSNIIQVNFRTDNDEEYKGFIAIFKTVNCKINETKTSI